ncbi:MAG: hypothetical protein ACYTFI_15685, partial [Planctomycetota bacterium]
VDAIVDNTLPQDHTTIDRAVSCLRLLIGVPDENPAWVHRVYDLAVELALLIAACVDSRPDSPIDTCVSPGKPAVTDGVSCKRQVAGLNLAYC